MCAVRVQRHARVLWRRRFRGRMGAPAGPAGTQVYENYTVKNCPGEMMFWGC